MDTDGYTMLWTFKKNWLQLVLCVYVCVRACAVTWVCVWVCAHAVTSVCVCVGLKATYGHPFSRSLILAPRDRTWVGWLAKKCLLPAAPTYWLTLWFREQIYQTPSIILCAQGGFYTVSFPSPSNTGCEFYRSLFSSQWPSEPCYS